MNDTGKGSYLWHLDRAAALDQQAGRHDRRGMWIDADTARVQAAKHRDMAYMLRLELKVRAI